MMSVEVRPRDEVAARDIRSSTPEPCSSRLGHGSHATRGDGLEMPTLAAGRGSILKVEMGGWGREDGKSQNDRDANKSGSEHAMSMAARGGQS